MHATIRAVRPAAISLVVLLLITACARTAAPSGSPASTGPDASERPAQSIRPLQTPPASEETVVGEVPQEILNAILADAADRSGAALAAIEVVTAEQVTWPDGSLGCPEPGQSYTQALVDGYQVVVDAGRRGARLPRRLGRLVPALRERAAARRLKPDPDERPRRRTGGGASICRS